LSMSALRPCPSVRFQAAYGRCRPMPGAEERAQMLPLPDSCRTLPAQKRQPTVNSMRSLIVMIALAFLYACGDADVGEGSSGATATSAVIACPDGSVLCGKTCTAPGQGCPKRPPPHSCSGVMCPMFVDQCPPGEVWGRRLPTDCCIDACVKAADGDDSASATAPATGGPAGR
jgi:hypothetical protein